VPEFLEAKPLQRQTNDLWCAKIASGIGDFSDPANLKGKTDGELFYIIKNGQGQMPPEGDRVKPTELWNMINYIRSLSNKKSQ
jgi:mono/diheme cytochrome c family protein